MGIALAWFATVVRLRAGESLALLAFLSSFWPYHLYVNTGYRLVPVMALCTVAAGHVVAFNRSRSVRHLVTFSVVGAILSLINPTYLTLIAIAALLSHGTAARKETVTVGLAFGAPVLVAATLFALNISSSAPYEFSFMARLAATLRDGLWEGAHLWFYKVFHNGLRFVGAKDFNALWLLHRTLLLTVFTTCLFSRVWKRHRLVVLMASGGMAVLIANVVLYDIGAWRDYRLLSPWLLLCGLTVLTTEPRHGRALLLCVAVANLSGTGWALDSLWQREQRVAAVSGPALRIAAMELEDHMVLRPRGFSGWCNTLLVPFEEIENPTLAMVPVGFGLSFATSDDGLLRARSRFVMGRAGTPSDSSHVFAVTGLGTIVERSLPECK
jgi:hypothetical protein